MQVLWKNSSQPIESIQTYQINSERVDHTGTQGAQKQNYLLPQPNEMRTVTRMGATNSLI
jgi:hypothetical protein